MISINCNSREASAILKSNISTHLQDNSVILCIGCEKVVGDSLGPRVGSLLNQYLQRQLFIYGMLGANVNATNLVIAMKFIKIFHPDSKVIVVDAAVGDECEVGCIQSYDNGIMPGAATNKNLPKVGDISILGVVSTRTMSDFYTNTTTKNNLINQMAQVISNGIMSNK